MECSFNSGLIIRYFLDISKHVYNNRYLYVRSGTGWIPNFFLDPEFLKSRSRIRNKLFRIHKTGSKTSSYLEGDGELNIIQPSDEGGDAEAVADLTQRLNVLLTHLAHLASRNGSN